LKRKELECAGQTTQTEGKKTAHERIAEEDKREG